MSVSIDVTLNIFPQLVGQFDPMVEGALDAGTAAGIAAADPRTPRDTGALAGNKVIVRSPGYREIGWLMEYAPYQNFGTSRGVPAHGFAEAGADAALPVINAELGRFGG
jgi:hypothetical protein